MPPGSSKNKKGGGTDLVCDLCCDTLEKGQDILKCEGSCGCNVHRYGTGVTKPYFEELVKGSTPFVCQYYALNVYKNIVQQLQDEVASLKSELAETKGLCERLNQSPPTASYSSVASKQPASKQPAKHRGQKIQKGQWPPAKQPTTARTGAAPPTSTETIAGESNSAYNDVRVPRVRVDGARRVWGTMSHTTSNSVGNVITRCCNLAGLKIRRKTRTADTGKISWWFVIHTDEAVLCELDSKWEAVNLQTSWQLKFCLKTAAVIVEETHTGGTDSPLQDNPSSDITETEAGAIPNTTSTTNFSLPIPCNPTVPSSFNTTDQPQLTAPFLGVTQEMATPPSQ